MASVEKAAVRRRGVKLLDVIALATFGEAGEKLARALRLHESLQRAGLYIHPRLYAARLILFTLVAALASASVAGIVVYLGAPLLVKFIVLVVAIIVPLLVFVWGIYYPSAKAAERAMKTEMEFPFFAAYMTAMAYGGVSPERLIERLAEMRVFKALREEAVRVLREVKFFGINILAALERNALWHPSRIYRDFILGYLTTLRTGGDVIHYLEIRTTEVFQARMEDLRNRAERVGLIVEAYAAVAVLGTMAFYIFFIISGLVATGGGLFSGPLGLALYNFIILPLVALAIIMLLDSMLPSSENIREPYAYLAISAPLGVVLGLSFLSLTGGLAYQGGVDTWRVERITISLAIVRIVTSLGPALKYMTQVRRERAVSYRLAAFFRDLSEVRRTGLSPEKSIIMLSERDYGPLTPIIQRIAGALSMGLHVERAVRRAIRGYKNWMLRVTMRFLVDAMEVGGGSPHTIDSLARFLSTLVEINEQLKKRLRPYIVMPYFGSIMVAATALLTLSMLVNAISAAGGLGGQMQSSAAFGGLQVNLTPENVHTLLLMASLASLVNAWLSGLVAGKIQDQSVASGFLHATILVAVTTIVIIVLLQTGGSFGFGGAGQAQAQG